MTATTTTMNTAATASCPRPRPLADLGMPKKSANDAPIGRVRM